MWCTWPDRKWKQSQTGDQRWTETSALFNFGQQWSNEGQVWSFPWFGRLRKIGWNFAKVNLQSLSKCAKLLDFVRLEVDLIGLYSSQTMRNECKSPRRLLNFLAHKDLIQLFLRQHSCFSWSLSALKRNKTYSWSRTVPPWQWSPLRWTFKVETRRGGLLQKERTFLSRRISTGTPFIKIWPQ